LLKSIEDISPTKKRISIEIPVEIIEKEFNSSLEILRNRVKIPGFRPGKAPVNLIEKRFGKEIEAEVLDKLIPEHYNMALREADLQPVSMPEMQEKFEFKRHNPINMTFVIEVLPKIENLNYENIKVEDIPVTVEDSDVDSMLKQLQEQKAVLEVSEEPVSMDDLISFELADSKLEGDEEVPELKEALETMGNEIFPPDIMERALGKKKDDIIEFTRTFEDNFKYEKLRGKTATIRLVLKEIKKKSLPSIDDEFAKDLGYNDMNELREKLKERIHSFKKQQIQRIQKASIINNLIESINPPAPESLVNREIEALIMQKSVSEEEPAVETDSVKEVLDIAAEKKPEENPIKQQKAIKEAEDEELKRREKAIKNVQASMIIDAIGKKEAIFVTDDEVDRRIELIARSLSATPEALRSFYMYKEGSLDSLKHSIFQEKVLDFLLSKASIEAKENK
jgi:trigger factor